MENILYLNANSFKLNHNSQNNLFHVRSCWKFWIWRAFLIFIHLKYTLLFLFCFSQQWCYWGWLLTPVCVWSVPTVMQYPSSVVSKMRGIPMWPAPRNVPCFISSQGSVKEGADVKRPLFLSFVYVRSGSRVLGKQRSLGMLDLYAHI